MMTLIFYFVWRFMLNKDDEIVWVAVLFSFIDGGCIYMLLTDVLMAIVR